MKEGFHPVIFFFFNSLNLVIFWGEMGEKQSFKLLESSMRMKTQLKKGDCVS